MAYRGYSDSDDVQTLSWEWDVTAVSRSYGGETPAVATYLKMTSYLTGDFIDQYEYKTYASFVDENGS